MAQGLFRMGSLEVFVDATRNVERVVFDQGPGEWSVISGSDYDRALRLTARPRVFRIGCG
jgi:hypothetical protein